MLNLDLSLVEFLNQAVGRSNFLDRALATISGAYSLATIPLLACVWFLWFRQDPDMRWKRETMLREFVGVCLAGPLSRILQLTLPFHARPFFTPGIHLRVGDPGALNLLSHWNSLPSDHAAVYCALAIVVSYHSRKLAVPAWVVVVITLLCRAALAVHWPSDLLAGGIVGFLCVWACRKYLPEATIRPLMTAQIRRPDIFSAAAFFICYQVGTLFEDIRRVGAGLKMALAHVV